MSAISTVLAIFLLLLTGYAAKRLGILKPKDAPVVHSIVTNFTAPAFVFIYIHGKPITGPMIKAPAVVFVCSMLIMGLAFVIARLLKFDSATTGGLLLAAAYGNTGFLGYPVTLGAFPHHGEAIASTVMIDQFAMALPLYSIGVVIAASFASGSSKFDKRQLLEFLKTPLFPATVLALIFRTTPVPAALMTALTYLGNATIPLAMISLGLSISRMPVKSVTVPFTVAFLLKMVAMPIIAFFALRWAGIGGIVRDVAVLESGMPTAIMAGVLANRYGSNGPFVSGAIFLMTLLSILTIPAILTLLH